MWISHAKPSRHETSLTYLWIVFKLPYLDKTYIRCLQDNSTENNFRCTHKCLEKISNKRCLFQKRYLNVEFLSLVMKLSPLLNLRRRCSSQKLRFLQCCHVFDVGFPTKYHCCSNVVFLKSFSWQKSNWFLTNIIIIFSQKYANFLAISFFHKDNSFCQRQCKVFP